MAECFYEVPVPDYTLARKWKREAGCRQLTIEAWKRVVAKLVLMLEKVDPHNELLQSKNIEKIYNDDSLVCDPKALLK